MTNADNISTKRQLDTNPQQQSSEFTSLLVD